MPKEIWKSDDCDTGISRQHRIIMPLVSVQTARQLVEIDVYENFGVGLRLDKSPQCSAGDTAKYHEHFAHTILMLKNEKLRVGVAGGGDYGLLKEILKHDNIHFIKTVEWDPDFVELAKEYLVPIHFGCWAVQKHRHTIEFANAFEYLPSTKDKFHVLFGDLVDLASWNVFLPNAGEYIKKILFPNGIFINQSGDGSEAPDAIRKLLTGLTELEPYFSRFWIFKVHIHFFGYEQLFVIATDDTSFNPLYPTEFAINRQVRSKIRHGLFQYSGSSHRGSFALSYYMKEALRDVLKDKFLQYYLV